MSDKIGVDLVESLLNHLPNAPFATKDAALRYETVNDAMLELCGVRNRADVVGKTAQDFFGEPTRRRFEDYDRQVLRTRKPLKDRLDLCVRTRGRPVWLLTSLWPVLDSGGQAIGTASIARVLEAPERRHAIYERLAGVIEHMHASFGAPVDISEMAERAGVSISQLERDFVGLFGLPPRRYLTKIRFEAALDLLKAGGSIAEVAHACGYVDQSAFTRRFRAAIGMSPREYRRTSAGSGSS